MSPRDARAALDRLLSSGRFVSSERSSQFLRHIVESALDGRGDELKEYSIGLAVFGRPPSFDPRIDTIVRVQARRLRQRLSDYYDGEGKSDPVRIALPTGSYVPEFQARTQVRAMPFERSFGALFAGRAVALWVGLGACVLFVAAAFFTPRQPRAVAGVESTDSRPADSTAPAPLSVPLTAFGGQEREPDLSPDGERVAFIWDGDGRTNNDLYVKTIEGEDLNRLTTDPAAECCPAWSPDSRRIAFLRSKGSGAELYTISASGNDESFLAELATFGHTISWSANGDSLFVEEARGISMISAEDGSKRSLTTPPDGSSDIWPAVSPDGKVLAFARGNRDFAVYALDLDNLGALQNEPRRVTAETYMFGGLDWTPDGRDLVFGAFSERVGWRLWKVLGQARADAAVPLAILGWNPSFARRPLGSNVRLAYAATADDKNIYRIPGPAARTQSAPEWLAPSTRNDSDARFSPAGDRIVFVSGRSGFGEIWTAASDGTGPTPLTRSERSEVGSPSWSPDGRRIAFSAMLKDSFDVYVVDASGGAPQRLTFSPANEGSPSFSGDGEWVYFMSDRTGRPEIWKAASGGGQEQQVTKDGGYQAVESPNGGWLYYSKSIRRPGTPESVPGKGEPGIFRMPLGGGAEQRVLEEGVHGRWALSRTGIYVLTAGDRPPRIEFVQYETWDRRTLMTFPMGAQFGMSNSLGVSLDDRWIVYSKYDQAASDLMLVEDYR
ncbi:MAG: PD40 domain-containing protein [Acidobacteria bacterium]|nr:PD40 domain-containing protein [Acidobacteriota bacterium]